MLLERDWLNEFWRVDDEGKVALLLGKGVEGICNRVVSMWESMYCIA